MSEKHIGEVVQVIGPVLDIRFAHDELPALLNAIEIESNGAKLTAEVVFYDMTDNFFQTAFKTWTRRRMCS